MELDNRLWKIYDMIELRTRTKNNDPASATTT